MKTLMFTGIFGFRTDPFERSVKAASNIGYDGLEIRALSHLPEDSTMKQVREMKTMLDDHGLVAPAMFLPDGPFSKNTEAQSYELLDTIKQYVEWAVELGITRVALKAASPPPDKAREQDYETAALWLSRVADIFSEGKIKLLLETHHNNLNETLDSSLKLLNQIDRPNAGFALDFGNLIQAKEEYGEKAVEKLGRKIWHVHCKDISFFDEKPDHRPARELKGRFCAVDAMGRGNVDPKPLYKALLASGYEGYYTMESLAQGLELSPEELVEHDYNQFIDQMKECQLSQNK